VNTHWIVGGDRTIDKRPFGLACIGFPPFMENIIFFPEIENFMLNSNKICFWIDTLDHDSVLRPVLGVQKLVFTSSTNKAETIKKKGDGDIAFFKIKFNE
jgi:hypothetical protein